MKKNSGWAEGVVVIKGSIRAGDAGAERTWCIPDYAYVKVSVHGQLLSSNQLETHPWVDSTCYVCLYVLLQAY